MKLNKERLSQGKAKNQVTPSNEQEQQQGWISEELQRTMGRDLSDFSETAQNELLNLCTELGIRAGVRAWQLS